jgi:hypothetical protein
MLDGINSLRIQPAVHSAGQKEPHSLIDKKSITGILFLGVKGDISNILENNEKLDVFV